MKPAFIEGMQAFFSTRSYYKKIKKLKKDNENLILLAPKFGDFTYGMLYAQQLKKESGKKLAIYCPEKFVEYVKTYGCVDRIITYPNTRYYGFKFFLVTGLKYTFFRHKKKDDGIFITVPIEKYYKGLTVREIYRHKVFKIKHDEVQLLSLSEKKVKSIENFEQIKDKVVVINPYALSHVKNAVKIFQPVADLLKENGFFVYTNVIGKQKTLDGTLPLNCPVDELYSICQKCRAFISIRSGITDFCLNTNAEKIIVYIKDADFRFKHSLKNYGRDNVSECLITNIKNVEELTTIVSDKIIKKA